MYYFGIEVYQRKDCIMLKQSAYANKLLQQFKMIECNPTKYPMEEKSQLEKDVEGSLMNFNKYRCIIEIMRYLTHTRPDLSYVVRMVSRYKEKVTTCIIKQFSTFSTV